MKKILLIIVSIILVIIPNYLNSQEIADTRGKEFWFTFMPNFHNYRFNDPAQNRSTYSPDSLYIFISSETATQGVISATNYYGQESTWNFQINNPNQIFSLSLTDKLFELEGHNYGNMRNSFNQNLKKAPQHFRITTNDEVTVYALNKAETTSDAATIFPRDVLGTNYTIVSYNSHGEYIQNWDGSYNDGRTPSQFAVLAVENGTRVYIDPTVNVNGSKRRIEVTLNAGETYLVLADMTVNAFQDLTGSKILSDKPVAVFAGHQRSLVPRYDNTLNSRDHLYSQMRPDNTYGKKYIITPFPATVQTPDISTDVYRIIAIENGTTVKFNDNFLATLDAGEYYENVLNAAGIIESDKKIILAQYNGSNSNTNFYGQTYSSDPFMLLVPPMKQFLNKYTVTNIQVQNENQNFLEQYITIICPTAYLSTLKMNGNGINRNNFRAIQGTCFSYALLRVQDGTKNISCDKPFGVYAYGYGFADSYGYLGGMSFITEEEILPSVLMDQNICDEETIELTAQGGVEYLWFPADNLTCDTCRNPKTIESKNETYYVQITDRIGCVYLDSVKVNVIPVPIADAGDDILLCGDDYVELDAGCEAESYKWSPSNGLSCTDCRYPTANPVNSTTYYLEVSNGKCKTYDTISVKVRALPELLVSSDYEICEGDTAFAQIASEVRVNWLNTEYISCTDCQNPKLYPPETTTYYVNAVSADGCVSSDSLVVYVNPLPELILSDDIAACPGELIQLEASGATQYNWYPSEYLSCDDCENPIFTAANSQTIYCIAENQFGCQDFDSVHIKIYEKPEIETEPKIEICRNEQIQLNVSGVINCKWYPSDYLSCDDCLNPIFTAAEDMNYMIIGENESGCLDTANIEIAVRNCEISVDAEVNFSNILLCNYDTQALIITNPNPSDIQIYELLLSGADKDAFDISAFKGVITIAGKNSEAIPIQFNPYKKGIHTAQVQIISSADSTKSIELRGEAYLTEAIFNLTNDAKSVPTDTVTFTVSASIKLLNELNAKGFIAKIKYDPIWMYFTDEYEINEILLPDWSLSATAHGKSAQDYYLEFIATGDTPLKNSGVLFSFKNIIFLSNTLEFTPELEVSLLDKDLCVITENLSDGISLNYCVEDLRFIVISDKNYKFNVNEKIITRELEYDFEIPFDQEIELTITNSIGEIVLQNNSFEAKGENKQRLNLSALPSGVYFITFSSGVFKSTEKVIIVN